MKKLLMSHARGAPSYHGRSRQQPQFGVLLVHFWYTFGDCGGDIQVKDGPWMHVKGFSWPDSIWIVYFDLDENTKYMIL